MEIKPTHTLFLLSLAYASLTLAAIALPGAGSFAGHVRKEAQAAATFFVTSTTSKDIRAHYEASAAPSEPQKLKILIVPGHQPTAGGTMYHQVYERDIVADIATDLAQYLAKDPQVEVKLARTKEGWDGVIANYFADHTGEIEAFRARQSQEMAAHEADNSISRQAAQMPHVNTAEFPAFELYGINKFANDEHYDITIHLHINDYSERAGRPQKYEGFAVYVPDHQYSNAGASRELGEAIAARLSAYHATSTLPGEAAGVVEDQDLIAIGANNSADDAALLIEYGYIYEAQFQNPAVRALAEQDYAYATYLGIRDFLGHSLTDPYGSSVVPASLPSGALKAGDVYALQAELHYLGFYPPAGKSLVDCPIGGHAGPCTAEAIKAYQTAHGLEATGTLGPATKRALEADAPPV